MAKEEMKIEDLARIIQEGFGETNTKFAETNAKIDALDTKIQHQIDGLDIKISAYASRWSQDFERLHEWVKDIECRVKFLEKQTPVNYSLKYAQVTVPGLSLLPFSSM